MGVEASRIGEVERDLVDSNEFERRSGAEPVTESSTRLVGMRRTSFGRVRESMSGFMKSS